MNIYLVGYRCTGKTSVGERLARRLGMDFADTDHLLEQEAGMHIANYVSRYGWERFRDLEARIIKDLTRRQRLVAATGGGAVLRPQNVMQMKESGIIAWLTARPETILARMQNDESTANQRPPLGNDPLAREVYNTLAQRTPLYENACHIRAATDDTDIGRVCENLLEKIRSSHAWKHFRHPVSGNHLG